MKKYLFLFTFAMYSLFAGAQISLSSTVTVFPQMFGDECYMIVRCTSTHAEPCVPVAKTKMKIEFFNEETTEFEGYEINSKSNENPSTTMYYPQTNNAYYYYFYRFDISKYDIGQFQAGIKRISFYDVPTVFRKTFDSIQVGKKIYEAFKEQENLF